MVRVRLQSGGVVAVTTDSVARRLGWHVSQLADILAGFSDPTRVTVQRDRATAIAQAIASAGADDVVLVAGKGHEPYQDVAGVRHPFDDTLVARDCLRRHA